MFDLPKKHFRAILVDPPWKFLTRSEKGGGRSAGRHYSTMTVKEMMQMPVRSLAADDCCLFMWATWPQLKDALDLMDAWGFTYKTAGFDWMKAHVGQIELFRDDADVQVGMGYWTRSNSEPCLLGVIGAPKRRSASVRMGIIEPRREHSRKPDCVRDRIEQLVDGPYLELFARQRRFGWMSWGNEPDKFSAPEEMAHV